MKTKESVKAPPLASQYVLDLPQPPVRNAEEYLKAYIGYIYTAVGAIAQEVASIDLHLYKTNFTKTGPETKEIHEHPALSVLHYANQISTLYDLIEATQVYLELTGESFWVVLRDNSGMPKEIWLLRPDWVKVIPSADKVIDHYNYYAGGVMSEKVEIPRENIIPFKYFNPLNPYRGKGATQAAALPFDILNFAQEYNRNFFFNSAIPSMVFSTDQKISAEAVKRFLTQWQSSFSGRSKSNKVAFLGQGLKLDKASFGAKELDFSEQMKSMRDDVLAVFKVPKTVLGLTEDVNRANADSTTRAFMERVITPRMRKFIDTLNEFYLPMFVGSDNSIFFDFTDPSPEDTEIKLKKYENARKYNWMTPNEIRMEENLEPLEGGDDLFATSLSKASNSLLINPDGTIPPTDNKPTPSADETPSDEEEDDTTKPTGKGFFKKFFSKTEIKVMPYVPPAYLKSKEKKFMTRLPVKRLEKLEEEKLASDFVAPLKQFIAELISQDDYSPLQKEKAKESPDINPEIKKALENMAKDLEKDKKKEKEEDKTTSQWSDEKKDAHWNTFSEKAYSDEDDIKKVSIKIFKKQEKLIISNLEESNKSWKKRLGKKILVSSVIPSLLELSAMWSSLEALLTDIYSKRGQEALTELVTGLDFNITTDFAVQYLNEYSGVLIKEINTTTRDALGATLAEGFEAGESIPKLTKRVKEVFETATTSRATAIARTESIKAANSASVEAYRQSNVVIEKEWLAERDTRTCPFCLDLDGKTISLDKYYAEVGDTLTGKNDKGEKVTMEVTYTDIGEPPAHTSCRCTVIPVIRAS